MKPHHPFALSLLLALHLFLSSALTVESAHIIRTHEFRFGHTRQERREDTGVRCRRVCT